MVVPRKAFSIVCSAIAMQLVAEITILCEWLNLPCIMIPVERSLTIRSVLAGPGVCLLSGSRDEAMALSIGSHEVQERHLTPFEVRVAEGRHSVELVQGVRTLSALGQHDDSRGLRNLQIDSFEYTLVLCTKMNKHTHTRLCELV